MGTFPGPPVAREAVRQEELSPVGIAFRTDRRVADKVVKGLKLHGS